MSYRIERGKGRAVKQPQMPQIPIMNAVPVMPAQDAPTPYAQSEVPKQYTPIGAQLSAWIEPIPKTTESGLIVPEKSMANFRTVIARVIAVGPKCVQVKPGDRILVADGTNIMKIKVDGMESILMFEERVLGILD